MPEMQFHFLNRRVVAGGESERLDLIVWGYSCPGIVLIKRRCPALCFPEEPTSALMSPASRNKRDNYFGTSRAGKYDQRARVALRENKAVVGVKALGGHIKAVGVASSLHQEACKLRFAGTDRRQSVLISDLRGGKKKAGLNTEGLKGAAAGWGAAMERRKCLSAGGRLSFISHRSQN